MKSAGWFTGCFAVPAAIFQLLAQELTGQRVVWFFEICADAENSAVDAGLRFAMKERPVVEPLKYEPLVDAVDHFASLLAGGVEAEVLQDDESVEGNKQAPSFGKSLSIRGTAPVAGGRLAGEKLGSPAFGCDARPLGCNRVGGFTGEVPHDLPTDGRVRIEEPFDVRGPRCVIVVGALVHYCTCCVSFDPSTIHIPAPIPSLVAPPTRIVIVN